MLENDTYFFGAASPIFAAMERCYCAGMRGAGVRNSLKFLVGLELLADPVRKPPAGAAAQVHHEVWLALLMPM